jgi:hypothetical protein
MKKILIALLTFLLGVFAFNLLNFEKAATSQTFAPVQKVVEIPETQIEDFPNQKIGSSEPFFNSFNENEGYGGWLIADKFKGMKEVWTILLTRDNENSDESKKLVWTAMILTMNGDDTANDDDNFHSVWIKTENNHLSFRTNKIRGIEYKFDGKFFKRGKDFSDDEKVLKGTLQKIVKGKEAAKFTADFAYQEPVCFH